MQPDVRVAAVVLRADARALPLPDACADLIVTSPPYFGLRSYTDDGSHYDSQIGSEATAREYIAALLACTREWMRVLKPSGSIFVNLGDKYNSAASNQQSGSALLATRGTPRAAAQERATGGRSRALPGVQPKSLLGLPWRFALACTDDLGLILRRDIIWSKPNGLPESVTDRCRSSHEYLFHLVKQPRYYAAVDEIREPHEERFAASHRPGNQNGHKTIGTGVNLDLAGVRKPPNPLGKLPGSVWKIGEEDRIWEIPSQPLTVPPALGVDHFAAFPMELPRRIILGWSPPGICTACGEGRRPVAYVDSRPTRPGVTSCRDSISPHFIAAGSGGNVNLRYRPEATRAITGYACACPDADAATRPAVVVDPFGGTGTTALVASMLGRTGVSVDLSADYCRLAAWRTTDPAERARALLVPKPPSVPDGQGALFGLDAGWTT